VRHGVLLVSVLLILLSGPATVHADTSTGASSTSQGVQYNYTVVDDTAADRLQVRVSVSLPENVVKMRAAPDGQPAGLEVTRLDGFEKQANGTIVWDKETPRPSMRYTINSTQVKDRGIETTGDTTWNFIHKNDIRLRFKFWYYDGPVPSSFNIDTTGEGFAGTSIAVLGNHTTYHDPQAGIRLIVPATVTLDRSPQAILTTLNQSHQQLDTNTPVSTLNVFIAPESFWTAGLYYAGLQNGTADAWVREDYTALGMQNVFVHEYAHAQQRFKTTRNMSWFTEGSAEYYSTLLPLYQNQSTHGTFRGALIRTSSVSTVGDPDSWHNNAEYQQGSRIVAALDAHIRADTNGTASITAVIERMNKHPEPVSLEAFRSMVVDVSGNKSLANWTTRYVTTQEQPPIPMAQQRYARVDRGDSDNDGLSDRTETSIGTEPFTRDTDGDGLSDATEQLRYDTDPLRVDTDDDGLSDNVEVQLGTRPATPTNSTELRRIGVDSFERWVSDIDQGTSS
jgi:hypothetical protein